MIKKLLKKRKMKIKISQKDPNSSIRKDYENEEIFFRKKNKKNSKEKEQINKTIFIKKENFLIDPKNPNIKYKIKEKNKFLNEFRYDETFDKENFDFVKLGKSLNVVGRGAFSEVLLARNQIDQRLYAIKKVNFLLILIFVR